MILLLSMLTIMMLLLTTAITPLPTESNVDPDCPGSPDEAYDPETKDP